MAISAGGREDFGTEEHSAMGTGDKGTCRLFQPVSDGICVTGVTSCVSPRGQWVVF